MPSAPAPSPSSHSAATLLDPWRELVATAPDTPALIEAATGVVHSRADIDAQADAWAKQHRATPLRGRRAAFAWVNGPAWLATFLGLLKSGATPLPLDSTEPLVSQRLLATQGGAGFLVTSTGIDSLDTPPPDDPPDLCLIKLTSGTTGTPRPLPFTHRQMLADGSQVCRSMAVQPDDLNLAIIPFGHSYGLGNLVIPLLAQGTGIVCVSAPLPHAIENDCARWRPTVFPVVPALLRVLTLSELAPASFDSLRVVISAGSLLSADTAQGFYQKYHRVVHGFYGSSETGGITYDRSGEATLAGRSVGTPLDGVHLRFDEDRRFWVESAAVFTHGNPHVSTSGLGTHSPADQAELNSFGELALLGRTGRTMKIAGRRIDLAELEQTLRRIPDIQDAFVIAHPSRADELAAVIATPLDLESARTRLRDQLAPWKLPRRLLVLPEFPLTARGKPDTRALQDLLLR